MLYTIYEAGDFMRLLIAEDEKHLNKTLNERLTKASSPSKQLSTV